MLHWPEARQGARPQSWTARVPRQKNSPTAGGRAAGGRGGRGRAGSRPARSRRKSFSLMPECSESPSPSCNKRRRDTGPPTPRPPRRARRGAAPATC
eukprot:11469023-Alexandrium_andersonii.AAC.1